MDLTGLETQRQKTLLKHTSYSAAKPDKERGGGARLDHKKRPELRAESTLQRRQVAAGISAGQGIS